MKEHCVHVVKRKGLFFLFNTTKQGATLDGDLYETNTRLEEMERVLGVPRASIESDFYVGKVFLISSYLDGYKTPALINPYMIPKIDGIVSFLEMSSPESFPSQYSDFSFQ